MEYVAACLIGYLLGSIPVSLIVARRHGVDLRTTGDGNPGAWNALEQLGARRAWPAFAGDALKAALAAGAGLALGGVWVGYAAVGAAMIGHAFPAFAPSPTKAGHARRAPSCSSAFQAPGLPSPVARRSTPWARPTSSAAGIEPSR